MTTKLRGRCFGSNEGVMEAVNEFFQDQNREIYFEGLLKLEHNLGKYIDEEGDYSEKLRPLVGFYDYQKYIGPITF
jgi:hypothetical protein